MHPRCATAGGQWLAFESVRLMRQPAPAFDGSSTGPGGVNGTLSAVARSQLFRASTTMMNFDQTPEVLAKVSALNQTIRSLLALMRSTHERSDALRVRTREVFEAAHRARITAQELRRQRTGSIGRSQLPR